MAGYLPFNKKDSRLPMLLKKNVPAETAFAARERFFKLEALS